MTRLSIAPRRRDGLGSRVPNNYLQAMADFDDTFDADLGAACNRLAAWVEPLPEGAVIDATTQLTERDLALILRRLYATRLDGPVTPGNVPAADDTPRRPARASVPITARG